MKARTHSLLTALSLFLSYGPLCAAYCELSDAEVKDAALGFVKQKTNAKNGVPKRQDFKVEITQRGNRVWTVVVSPLPVTPDASFMLQVRCGLVVEEIGVR